MLTVDFARLGVVPGDRVLDLGCGAGRHAFELYRRGADVVAFDRSASDLAEVGAMFGAMELEGEVPAGARAATAMAGSPLDRSTGPAVPGCGVDCTDSLAMLCAAVLAATAAAVWLIVAAVAAVVGMALAARSQSTVEVLRGED